MTVVQGGAGTAQRDEKCDPFSKERHQFLHKAKKKLRVSKLSEATPAPHTYTDIETTATRERERGSISSSPN